MQHCSKLGYSFFRRFSGGFGSRDYRTTQTGGRPGGSMGGPRTSGGGSFPNYNAPPPSHGRTQDWLLTSYFISACFSLFFAKCALNAFPSPHPRFSYLYWVCGVPFNVCAHKLFRARALFGPRSFDVECTIGFSFRPFPIMV
jgi:hypothetical protein